jgi:hypothetical protein
MNTSKASDPRTQAKWRAAGAIPNPNRVFGLSIGQCVAAIIAGEVKLENVAKIYGGTNNSTPAEWDRMVASYRESLWAANPDEGERIFRQLLAENRIIQPWQGLLPWQPDPEATGSIWVKSRHDIVVKGLTIH